MKASVMFGKKNELSKHLLVQSQPQKHQNTIWNMFKVNN